MRVLVVEDETRMAAHLGRALAQECFAVDVAHDGERAWDLLGTCDYDAIVLDLMLPGIDGLTLCRRLRQHGKRSPVLILSARDMIEDRVQGLDAGADDYLVKPFALEELLARIRALLRRRRQPTAVLTLGKLSLDSATREVRIGSRQVTLTSREYALLEYLLRRAGTVLTRAMIAEHVWDSSFDAASNVVDVYVKHLRDKLDVGSADSWIQSVRGVGYVLRDPDGAEPS
jgi:DNA-binding response OmpR family regulator